jgi:Mg2+ and Co2+ transporter CorA
MKLGIPGFIATVINYNRRITNQSTQTTQQLELNTSHCVSTNSTMSSRPGIVDEEEQVSPRDTSEGRRRSGRRLHETVRNVFANVGIVNPAIQEVIAESRDTTPSQRHHRSQSTAQVEPIFESNLDLTEDRLRYVFNLFDTDADGRIDYESLRRGLEQEVTGIADGETEELAEDSFQDLVAHLDLDGSGDISFEEFSEGIRILMLRVLLQQSPKAADSVHLEVMDYNAMRSVRREVVTSASSTSTHFGSHSVQQINLYDFFVEEARPEWATARWINLVPQRPEDGEVALKRLAVKFSLHPLAVEDALLAANQRPKVEGYSHHYYIMVPIFSIDCAPPQPYEPPSKSAAIRRFFRCGRKAKALKSFPSRPARALQVNIQMVSIFVNIPKNDTIITYTNGAIHKTEHHWDRVQRDLEKSYSKLRQYDAQYLTYALLDQAVDLLGPVDSLIRTEIGHEREYLRLHKFHDMDRIHEILDQIEEVSRKIKPFMRLVGHVIEDDAISPGATVYLRDVLDNLECHDDDVKQLIAECRALDVEAEKYNSKQMDNTLYTLTVVSSIFLPAQFLTGVWGMNFIHMPELDETWGYPMFWVLTAVIMVILFVALDCGRRR